MRYLQNLEVPSHKIFTKYLGIFITKQKFTTDD